MIQRGTREGEKAHDGGVERERQAICNTHTPCRHTRMVSNSQSLGQKSRSTGRGKETPERATVRRARIMGGRSVLAIALTEKFRRGSTFGGGVTTVVRISP